MFATSRATRLLFSSKQLLNPKFSSVRACSGSGSHSDFEPKRKAVPNGMEDVLKLIDKQVKENRVMLFMKGTPSKPQCGFSGQVVRILNAVGVDFASVNVMEFPSIREGIKTYS
jgi:monothiol glutaredoxin